MRYLIEQARAVLVPQTLEEARVDIARALAAADKHLKNAVGIGLFFDQITRFVRQGHAAAMAPEIETTANELLDLLARGTGILDDARKKVRDLQTLLQGYSSGAVGRYR